MRKWIEKRLKDIYDEEFVDIVEDLLDHVLVIGLEDCRHHIKTSRLQHCLGVSYRCYRICKRFGWDYVSAARAGVLHDFYHYDSETDHEDKVVGLRHLRTHPQLALKNARDHFELNPVEIDIIAKHMWPITFMPPRYKESWLIVAVDKYCAIIEFFRIHRKIAHRRHIHHP
ncbi:MAG: HD domain-containing protein [Turicibacter sp.]|nr:HD domain-containing protein [Turicibacter sp.]